MSNVQEMLWRLPAGREYTLQSLTDAGWQFHFMQQKWGRPESWFLTRDEAIAKAHAAAANGGGDTFRVVRVSRYAVDDRAIVVEILYYKDAG